MGMYIFKNPQTQEIKEIFQHKNDNHSNEENGIKWERIWVNPLTAIDSKPIDPFSAAEFVKRTGQKSGKLGDIIDYSKEQSIKRAEKLGSDLVLNEYYKNYSKKRLNKKHPNQKKQELKDSLKNNKVFEWVD